jgi:hypothetical protein
MAVAPDPTQTASPLAFLADEELGPLEIGHVVIDPNSGLLSRADQRAPIDFGFSFAGLTFEAAARQGDGDVILDCAAIIGRLPYTIEDRPRRAELNRALAALNDTGLKWQIDKDQAIRVGARIHVEPPATAPRLVVALVEHLLPVKGYFELLIELGQRRNLKAASAKPGTAVAAVG